MAKRYNVFISHAWEYNAAYDRLVNLLNVAPHLNWLNYSVTEHDPILEKWDKLIRDVHLEGALKDQIRPTNIVLIISGMYAAHSKWIQKEIDIANYFDKPIIGVVPWGGERVPREVSIVAKEMVSWFTSSIVNAIFKFAKKTD